MPACVLYFFSTPCRVTWSIEGGDEFGYENVITTHFASPERRPRANNGMQRTEPHAAADAERYTSTTIPKLFAPRNSLSKFIQLSSVRNKIDDWLRSDLEGKREGKREKERGHTYTPDMTMAADRLVAEEMKQSKAVGMLERELGA